MSARQLPLARVFYAHYVFRVVRLFGQRISGQLSGTVRPPLLPRPPMETVLYRAPYELETDTAVNGFTSYARPVAAFVFDGAWPSYRDTCQAKPAGGAALTAAPDARCRSGETRGRYDW